VKISFKTPGKLLRNWPFHIVEIEVEVKREKQRSCYADGYSFTFLLTTKQVE